MEADMNEIPDWLIVLVLFGVTVVVVKVLMQSAKKSRERLGSDDAVQQRLPKAARGLFFCNVNGSVVEISGARSYLVSEGKINNQFYWIATNLALQQDGIHTVADDGIHPHKLTWYKNNISAETVARAPGTFLPSQPTLSSQLAYLIGTEETALFIPWSELKYCLVEQDTGREIAFIVYYNRPASRSEWIAVELFSPKERELFMEALHSFGVQVESRPTGWLSEIYGEHWDWP